MNRVADPWLMELHDTLDVPVQEESWDRFVAQLTSPCKLSPSLASSQPTCAPRPRQLSADVEQLVLQLVQEVDRLLVHFDPALAPLGCDTVAWTKGQRASLLAHASGALIERGNTPAPERR